MGYVIAAVVVVLIVGGLVVFLVTTATRKSPVSDAGDPGAEANSLSIIGSDDESPAGSTSQHTSEETPRRSAQRQDRPDVARPVVGGEAEGERATRETRSPGDDG
jgi:hypothetical protein